MKISYKELISRFVHGKVTNRDIIATVDVNGCVGNREITEDCMELARADERAKMTQEKFAEYFNSLQGGEVASAILTNLLRRGVTDDDLRGLRLQWITDERAKVSKQGVKVWVCKNKHSRFKTIRGRITRGKPDVFPISGYDVNYQHLDGIGVIEEPLLDLLGVKEGEHRMFEIRECENG